MLILTRKLNEEIIIDSEIKVKILSISDNQVKIGIAAPSDVSIYRGEVYEKVKSVTLEASKASSQVASDLGKFKIKKVD